MLRGDLRGGDFTQQEQFMSSNIISLSHRQNPKAHDRGALLHSFAKMRRDPTMCFG